MNRPRPVTVVPSRGSFEDEQTRTRRPDPALPLVAAAFFLGVVISAVAGLAMRVDDGDTVPAPVHQVVVAELAAERSARAAAAERLDAQADALADADTLARRLVAALDQPSTVPAAELAQLRRAVTRQTERIERVRVVRVPVPGPTVTAAPAPGRSQSRPQPARQQTSAPAPAPAPPGCTITLLDVCVAR